MSENRQNDKISKFYQLIWDGCAIPEVLDRFHWLLSSRYILWAPDLTCGLVTIRTQRSRLWLHPHRGGVYLRLRMDWWNGENMKYWESKTDEGLILVSDLCHHHKIRSHSAKPTIPSLQYSIIPLGGVAAQPICSDPRRRDQRLAQRTSFSKME